MSLKMNATFNKLQFIFIVLFAALNLLNSSNSANAPDDFSSTVSAFDDGKLENAKQLIHYAEQGKAEAQWRLGLWYLTGFGGIKTDQHEALSLIQKAANQENSDALYLLGRLYNRGIGVDSENGNSAASEYFIRAAEIGHPGAQSVVGDMYKEGEHILQDYKKAIKWYKKAAHQGYAYAQLSLGEIYESGSGTLRNSSIAYMWFTLSAIDYESAMEDRDRIKKTMTPTQVEIAEEKITEFKTKYPKNWESPAEFYFLYFIMTKFGKLIKSES